MILTDWQRISPALRTRADYIAHKLGQLYPNPPIPLEHKDPYTLLVAVLLSAQCTDIRVNQITPKLFALADNPWDMRNIPQEEVLEVVRPCGLGPQKSKAIVGLSDILCREYNGIVPVNMTQLEQLPGVGHKTASVVMSQAFGVPAFPVDTHIHRLARRWRLSSGRSVEQTERHLKKLYHEELWNDLHLQIIFYGREHCSARGCDGAKCGICKYVNENRASAKPKTPATQKIHHKK